MVKYRLTCKNCNLNNIHDADSLDDAKILWKNWNVKYGENMKCVHEYEFTMLN